MKNKIFNNKIAKGLVSLITIIVLISSILATSIYYNNITANAVKEISLDSETGISITQVDGIEELSFLNEGWYEIRNGFVFYLDTFNSYVPLYIKVLNQEQQNGLLAVDADGDIEFGEVVNLLEREVVDEDEEIVENEITGDVTGLEGVSGYTFHCSSITDFFQRSSCETTARLVKEQKSVLIRIKVNPNDPWYEGKPTFQLRKNEQTGQNEWYETTPRWGPFFPRLEKLGIDVDIGQYIQNKYGTQIKEVEVTFKDEAGRVKEPFVLSQEYLKSYAENSDGRNLISDLTSLGYKVVTPAPVTIPPPSIPAVPEIPKLTKEEQRGQYEVYKEKGTNKLYIDLGQGGYAELKDNKYEGVDGKTYTLLKSGEIFSEQTEGNKKSIRYVDAKGVNYDVEITDKEIKFVSAGGNELSADDLRYIAKEFSGTEVSNVLTQVKNIAGISDLQVAKSQEDALKPAVAPPITEQKSESVLDRLWTWTLSLLRGEQKPAEPEQKTEAEAVPEKTPILSRQEIDIKIENLERQIEEKIRQGAERPDELAPLEREINRLKNTAPPSERYIKLAKAAGIDTNEIAQKYYDGDVKQVKVQDLNWELRNKLGAEFQSEGATFELKLNTDTYEYEIYLKGAKVQVHESEYPSLLKNVQPSSIQRETSAPVVIPAPSSVISDKISPPSPPQGTAAVTNYYHDEKTGQVYALTLGKDSQPDFYYEFSPSTRTWKVLDITSDAIDKIRNTENDNIKIKNLDEIQAIIQSQGVPAATEPASALPVTQEDTRVASGLSDEESRIFASEQGLIAQADGGIIFRCSGTTRGPRCPGIPSTPITTQKPKEEYIPLYTVDDTFNFYLGPNGEVIGARTLGEFSHLSYDSARKKLVNKVNKAEIDVVESKNTLTQINAPGGHVILNIDTKITSRETQGNLEIIVTNTGDVIIIDPQLTRTFAFNDKTKQWITLSSLPDGSSPKKEDGFIPTLPTHNKAVQRAQEIVQIQKTATLDNIKNLYSISKNKEALELVKEELNKNPNDETLLRYAIELTYREKDYASLMIYAERLVALKPNDNTALNALAWADFKNAKTPEDLKRAEEYAIKSINIKRTANNVHTLASIYEKRGQTTEAENLFAEAYAGDSKDPEKFFDYYRTNKASDESGIEIGTSRDTQGNEVIRYADGSSIVKKPNGDVEIRDSRNNIVASAKAADKPAIIPPSAPPVVSAPTAPIGSAPATQLQPGAAEDATNKLISSLKVHGPISRDAKDPTAKEESRKQAEKTADELARIIWSESITPIQFNELAKKQGLSDAEKTEVTTRVEAAKSFTSSYPTAIINQIKPYGKPEDWKLDRFGNFICVRDLCTISTGEDAPVTYYRGQTFAPSGGDPSDRNWEANRDALVKLQGVPAVAQAPTPSPDALMLFAQFKQYADNNPLKDIQSLGQRLWEGDFSVAKVEDSTYVYSRDLKDSDGKPLPLFKISIPILSFQSGENFKITERGDILFSDGRQIRQVTSRPQQDFYQNPQETSKVVATVIETDGRTARLVFEDGTTKKAIAYEDINGVAYFDEGYNNLLFSETYPDFFGQAGVPPPAPAPPKPGPPAPPPIALQIGNLDPKYSNPPTSKESKFVRLDDFSVVDKKVCEKIQCEEITPGKQWVPGIGAVDMANPAVAAGGASVGGLPAQQQKAGTPKREGAAVINNRLVELYEKDKETNLQKLIIGRTYKPDGTIDKGGKEILVTSTIISGLDLKLLADVDLTSDVFSFRTPQKKVDISIASDVQTRTDSEIGKDGKTTRTITTEFFTSGNKKGETRTTTRYNLNDPQKAQRTEELQFADQSKRTINFKGDTNVEDKVTYKTKEGKTLELSGDDFTKLKISLDNNPVFDSNTNRFLTLAAGEGFRTAKLDEQNRLVEGNRKIQFINDDSKRILVFDGERVVKESTVKDGAAFTRTFSGNVQYVEEEVKIGAGAAYETYDSKGKLVQAGSLSGDGRIRSDAEYTNKGITLSVTTKNPDGTYSTTPFEISKQVDNPNSPVNGMYKFTHGIDEFYYDENILGGKVYKLEEQDGKQIKVSAEQFSKEEMNALGFTINKQRIIIEKKPEISQEASQRFFANVERVLTEFQGLGYYATLFFDEDSLLKWRDDIDRIFATAYLGTEYWSSAICGEYLDGEDDGVAYAETPQGLAQVAAHIEATRTEPLLTPTGREFIYKITFNVRNGDYDKDPRAPEEMNINIILKGEKTATIFKQEQRVKRGSSFGRIGRNAIVQDSKVFYNEICLTFDNVPFRWKVSNNEICNTIVESSGAPSTVSTATATTTASGSGAVEGDVNDF